MYRSPAATILVVTLVAAAARGEDYAAPREVKVLPIFFVPKGEAVPTPGESKLLMRHLEWARTRYAELLPGKVTFVVAEQKPRVFKSPTTLAVLRNSQEAGAPRMVGELLPWLKVNRFNCPYVLLTVVVNPTDDFPAGGGRSLNGGFDTGGGFLELSTFGLTRSPNFQSTLQHELGHSFGLPHVDVYGYDMKANDSIMSYNPSHHTNWLAPSRAPGKLNPEDLRGLAMNTRAFPKLRFDPEKDIPRGYAMSDKLIWIPPMTIPGQPKGPQATTNAGTQLGKIEQVVQGFIQPSKKVGRITFDPGSMWHSPKLESGWCAVRVTFPTAVELTRVGVHSQHSGEYHAATEAKVAVSQEGDKFREVAGAELKSADDAVTFPRTKAKVWRLEFRAGESGHVVLRGLRFFAGDDELFPPLVPYRP